MKAEIGRDVGGPSKGLLVKYENFKLTLVDQLATPGGKILAVVRITEGECWRRVASNLHRSNIGHFPNVFDIVCRLRFRESPALRNVLTLQQRWCK